MRTSKSLGSLLYSKAAKGKLGSSADLQHHQYPPDPAAYELIAIIGQGVSATVYLALCPALGVHVAIKAINLELLASPWEDIVHEAQTMRAYKHAAILPLLCSFVAGQQLWLVMPYMEGGSVAHLMRHSQPDGLTEPLIATIGRPVLEGLAYMHTNNAIHRDVKAGNVLVDKDGRVALADLGVSATFDRDQEWGQHLRARNTFVGTPCWMAPEVLEQADYGGAADIWSFGITLLEMAHGHAPFSKLPPMKVLMLTLQGEPPQLEREYHHRTFSAAMREVVAKCLQKEPGKRPSARALLEHRFFRQARDPVYLKNHLLAGLPPLPQRVAEIYAGKAATSARDNERRAVASQAAYVEDVLQWDFNCTAAAAATAGGTGQAAANGGGPGPDVGAAVASAAAPAAAEAGKDTAPGKDTSTAKDTGAGGAQPLPVNGSSRPPAPSGQVAPVVPSGVQRTSSVARQSGRFVVWEGGEPPPPPDSPVKDQQQGGLTRQRSISSPSLYLRHPSPDPSKLFAAQLQQLEDAGALQAVNTAAGPQQHKETLGGGTSLPQKQQQQQQQQGGLGHVVEAAAQPSSCAEVSAQDSATGPELLATAPAAAAAAAAAGHRPVSPGRPGSRSASPLRFWGALTDTLKHVLHREPSPGLGPGGNSGGGGGPAAGAAAGGPALPPAAPHEPASDQGDVTAAAAAAAAAAAGAGGVTPAGESGIAAVAPAAAAASTAVPTAVGGAGRGGGGRGGGVCSGKPPLHRAPTPPPPLLATTAHPTTTITTSSSSTSPTGATTSPGVSPAGVLRMQQPTAVPAAAAAVGHTAAGAGVGEELCGGPRALDQPHPHQPPAAAGPRSELSFSHMLLPSRLHPPQQQLHAESAGVAAAEGVSFTDALQLQQRRDQSPRSAAPSPAATAAAAAAAASGGVGKPGTDTEAAGAAGSSAAVAAGSKAHQPDPHPPHPHHQQQGVGSGAADAAAAVDAVAIKKAGRFTIRQGG